MNPPNAVPARPSFAEWSAQVRVKMRCSPSEQRGHLKTLLRRLDHIALRAANSGLENSHDRREMAALTWALNELVK